MTTPVRWGILSTARIATSKLVPALQGHPAMRVEAIASRELAGAQAAAQRLGIPRAYGSYEALLADPDIEAVYNPLPNHLHVPLTLAALRAGKHVLCEKPFAIAAADLEVLRPYTSRLHLREAFMVRFHPQWLLLRDRVRAGEIGEPRYLQVPFSYHNVDPADIRNQSAAGGGALYDIGCYAIVAGRWCFDAEPQRVVAAIDRDPVFGTDRLTSALLDFGDARHAVFSVSTQAARHQRLDLVGSRGRLEIEIPFNAPLDAPVRLWLDTGAAPAGAGRQLLTLPACNAYREMVLSFSQAVREAAPDAGGLDDAIAIARVIDALWRSGRSARFEQP